MRSHQRNAINVGEKSNLTVNFIYRIPNRIRLRQNIALDRAEFEERKQEPGKIFGEFCVAIKIKRLASQPPPKVKCSKIM